MKLSLDRPPLKQHEVLIDFGAGISSDAQGQAMMMMERYLREQLRVPAEVFKTTMPDDLKRRRDMTPEQRAQL